MPDLNVGYELLGSAPTNAAQVTDTRSKMANGRAVRQLFSEVNPLSNARSIFKFDAKIAHSAIDLRATER